VELSNIQYVVIVSVIFSLIIVSLPFVTELLLRRKNKKEKIKEKVNDYQREKEEWDRRRAKSQNDFDEMMREFNKRNEETLNRLHEHLNRMRQENRRRAQEAHRQRTEYEQKLIAYMNVVGISNYPFTKEEITKKRRVLSLKYHPDRNGGKDDKMKQINEACDYLENVAQG